MRTIAQRREEERNARLEAMLDAASELIQEKGIKGTTTKEIARRCALSEATVFFYFKNKDEILASLFVRISDYWVKELRAQDYSDCDLEQKLQKVWQFFDQLKAEHREYIALTLHLSQVKSGSLSEEVQQKIAINSAKAESVLAEILESGQQLLSGEGIAAFLWTTYLGLSIVEQSSLKIKGLGKTSSQGNANAYLTTLARGLLAKAPSDA